MANSHNNHQHNRHSEPLWKAMWRPAAAYVYLAICLMDFGIMPIIYEIINHSITNSSVVELALKFTDSAAQIEALHTLKQTQSWVPLTLQGNGMFHVAFGAILGVAAWTRGQEKAMTNASGFYGGQPGFNTGYGNFGGMNTYNPPFVQPMPQPQPNYNPTPKPVNPANGTSKVDLVNPDDPTNE